MPKHMIYPTPNPDGTDADRRIEVGWQKYPTGHVQIATTKLQPGADRDREYVDASSDEPLRPAWDGQFVDLDRDQINHLIRQLRQARTEAFGRDE